MGGTSEGVGLGVSVGEGVGDSVGTGVDTSTLLLNTSASVLLPENIMIVAGKRPTTNPKTKYFLSMVLWRL